MTKIFSGQETLDMVHILQEDGVLAVPTDTVYGLCGQWSLSAQARLIQMKQRPELKTFPVMVADGTQAKTIGMYSKEAIQLMEALMPGPLTIVVKKTDLVPAYVTGGKDTIAIRLATSEALKALLQKLNAPIFLTSANRSGQQPCKSIKELETAFPELQGILEGSCDYGQASTIVDCSKATWKILREGPITKTQILAYQGKGEE